MSGYVGEREEPVQEWTAEAPLEYVNENGVPIERFAPDPSVPLGFALSARSYR